MKFERMVSKIYFKFLIHTRCFLVREFKIYLFLYFYNNEYVDCDICFNGKYLKIYIFLRINFFDIFLLTCIPCVINHADFIWNCSNEYSTVLRFKITKIFRIRKKIVRKRIYRENQYNYTVDRSIFDRRLSIYY